MTDEPNAIDVATVRDWLADRGELAFVDVREEGQHGEGHPLLAVNLPYSRFELDIARLVPRRSCRIVLVDGDDGIARKAARRLAALGYAAPHAVAGGVSAWEAAGHPLFPSTNVPSKGFAEIVELDLHTPHVTAAELAEMQRAGRNLKILDSRTVEEFNRFHVPGAQTCPGAELLHRFAELVPDPQTLVVVSCAGRTRSIIGAQSLINAGVPNKVVSLQGGTQGWRLSGRELERDTHAALAPVGAAVAAAARGRAVAARFGVRRIDRPTLAAWRSEAATRTTYLLDVRTPEEYAAGHLPGSESAPGGQLVQAIDRWVGIRGARLVLVDDTGTRAIMTGHWLKQMGWDAAVLDKGLDGAALDAGFPASPQDLPAVPTIAPLQAAWALAEGAAAVVIGPSGAYRKAHPPGAAWTIRPRLDRLPAAVLQASRILVFAELEAVGLLAAGDLAELTGARLSMVEGGLAAWQAAGLPVTSSRGDPPDRDRLDFAFWNHDRHDGNEAAMRAYLRWETELPAELARDGLAGFRIAPAPGR
jgi:rhodanese-related sulfurtransferase